MTAYPPGGWSLQAYNTFNKWSEELTTLEGTKTLRKAFTRLLDTNTAFGKLLQPIEQDDEASNEASVEEIEFSVVTSSGKGKAKDMIVSRPKPSRSTANIVDEDDKALVSNVPKVTK
jgi:hypothetical protein